MAGLRHDGRGGRHLRPGSVWGERCAASLGDPDGPHRKPLMSRNASILHRARRVLQAGYTIVELMVSIAVGLFLVGALLTLLVTNSINSAELNKTGAQIENGRFAMQLLIDTIQHAGYLGQYSPTVTPTYALPADPCAVAVSGL